MELFHCGKKTTIRSWDPLSAAPRWTKRTRRCKIYTKQHRNICRPIPSSCCIPQSATVRSFLSGRFNDLWCSNGVYLPPKSPHWETIFGSEPLSTWNNVNIPPPPTCRIIQPTFNSEHEESQSRGLRQEVKMNGNWSEIELKPTIPGTVLCWRQLINWFQ